MTKCKTICKTRIRARYTSQNEHNRVCTLPSHPKWVCCTRHLLSLPIASCGRRKAEGSVARAAAVAVSVLLELLERRRRKEKAPTQKGKTIYYQRAEEKEREKDRAANAFFFLPVLVLSCFRCSYFCAEHDFLEKGSCSAKITL